MMDGQTMVTAANAKRLRVFSAWVCLLAVGLLLAPFAEAAWSAHAAACCTKDHCPIPEHHHSKTPAHTPDCEHQSGAAFTDCNMNCCEKVEHSLLTQIAFVLPASPATLRPHGVTEAARWLQSKDFVRSIDVVSPPPRFLNTSL
jgi:hypothetical protein